MSQEAAKIQKAAYETQKATCETQAAELRKKITILSKAKTDLEEVKKKLERRFEEEKKEAAAQKEKMEWKGDQWNTVRGYIDEGYIPDYKAYVVSVDDALDAICKENTRVSQQVLELEGAIGRLAASIRELAGQIETMIN